MVGKNNQYLKDTKQGTKVESYSIKKFKVGTASVVVGNSPQNLDKFWRAIYYEINR